MSDRVFVKGSFSEMEAEEIDRLIEKGWSRSRSDLVRMATMEYIANRQHTR